MTTESWSRTPKGSFGRSGWSERNAQSIVTSDQSYYTLRTKRFPILTVPPCCRRAPQLLQVPMTSFVERSIESKTDALYLAYGRPHADPHSVSPHLQAKSDLALLQHHLSALGPSPNSDRRCWRFFTVVYLHWRAITTTSFCMVGTMPASRIATVRRIASDMAAPLPRLRR